MGGGRKFDYPKWVWSPAGGWWANPTHWKRNTAIYSVFVAGVAFYSYTISTKNTKTYPPKLTASSTREHGHHGHH